MHFSSAVALVFFCLSVTNAAPLAHDDLVRRESTYSVVNVNGVSSSSSAVTDVETVFESMIVPGSTSTPATVSVTATPSPSRSYAAFSYSVPAFSSSRAASSSVATTSTPLCRMLQVPSPSSGTPLPTPLSPSSWRRHYGTSFIPSGCGNPSASSASVPASSTPLVARSFGVWYPPSHPTASFASASASVTETPLVARDWRASSSTPSWPTWSTPYSFKVSVSATPISTPLSATPSWH